jgi:hypothetical protein
MAITQEQVEKLKKGDTLRYTTHTGYGKDHIDAKVTVMSIGSLCLLVKVVEVFSKGEANRICDGGTAIAIFDQLSVLPK